MKETERAAGGILARFPEIPPTRHGVDSEERAESERDGSVRRLEALRWETRPLFIEQTLPQHVLRRE